MVAVFHSIALLLLGGLPAPATAGHVHVPVKAIAPNVSMPVLSIGSGGLERKATSSIVRNWLVLGGRGIDTASTYDNQGVVADAIEASGANRSEVFITTKIPGCDGSKMAVESNLKKLRTDYIDLLLIHFPQGDCKSAWAVLEVR